MEMLKCGKTLVTTRTMRVMPRVLTTATRSIGTTGGMFGFVPSLADNQAALVSKSKDTLRQLGHNDDHVVLHLPSENPTDPIVKALPHTAVVEICNVSARNAISGRMMAELADVVTQLEDPEVNRNLTTVVMRGRGGWFCAGLDLGIAKEELTSPEAGAAMSALMTHTLTRFRQLPLVSVAMIEGGAYGGGAELSTASDFRLIADNAVIQFVHAKMGISPCWGGAARLYRILGRQHALRLLCTAEKIQPQRALDLGLVDSVFKNGDSNAVATCVEFLRPFDALASDVCHGEKQVVTNSDDILLQDVLDRDRRVFSTLWGGPANVRAFSQALKKKKA